jgi:hypothetical protein
MISSPVRVLPSAWFSVHVLAIRELALTFSRHFIRYSTQVVHPDTMTNRMLHIGPFDISSPERRRAGLRLALGWLADCFFGRPLHRRRSDPQRILLLEDFADEIPAAGPHVAADLLGTPVEHKRRHL